MILALNEALQKTGEELDVQLCRVKYASSRAKSAVLKEKTDAKLLISQKLNMLIWTVKSVDFEVMRVEVLEHLQRLKVHGMLLEKI